MRDLRVALLLALLAPATAVAEPTVAEGRAVYQQFCSHCHGIDMVNPGTSSYDLRRFPRDQRERFEASVMHGKGSMPAWGDVLLPHELEAVWLYVVTRGGAEPPPEETAEATSPPPPPEARSIEEASLTVCLDRNGGAMSGRLEAGGRGYDYALAGALADRLGLDLVVTWYEGGLEEENDPVRETYAMLALGLCDAAPGHALRAGAMGAPAADRARPPPWMDMPEEWRLERGRMERHRQARPFVDLEPVVVTRPYARVEIAVAFAPGIAPRQVESLADLEGLRIGIEQGTLAGALTLIQGPERLRADSVTVRPGPRFLWDLETGRFEAALVTVPAFDFHRMQNPISGLNLSDWRHPLGYNLGVAVLAANDGLRARLDEALAGMEGDGTLAALAADEGLHYAAPRAPDVQPRLTLADLATAH